MEDYHRGTDRALIWIRDWADNETNDSFDRPLSENSAPAMRRNQHPLSAAFDDDAHRWRPSLPQVHNGKVDCCQNLISPAYAAQRHLTSQLADII
jgi:hypothetical protein